MRKRFLILIMAAVVVGLATPAVAGGGPTNPTALNARFMHWQENDAVIHIVVFADAGRVGFAEPAVVAAGQPLLFGVELFAPNEEAIRDFFDNVVTEVSVDGGDFEEVLGWWQEPFLNDGTGPAWRWDHDGDGRGDGDGDGIDDWGDGWYTFFRYPLAGFTEPGLHTVEFVIDDPSTEPVDFSDLIEVYVTAS